MANWLTTRERGSVLGVRFLVFIVTFGGRRLIRFVLRFVALYYVLFNGAVRRASRDYHRRLTGKPVGFWTAYRHLLRFAFVTGDRFFLTKGRLDLFEFTETGKEHLLELRENKRGAILLGGHIGSFESMRALSGPASLPLNIVGYFRNAKAFNEALEKYKPGCNVKLIEVDPSSAAFVFKIKKCIERGELVAILADRIGVSGGSAKATFLGEETDFAVGPYALAAVLRCPVYFTAGLYREPNRYDLHCELFAERVVLSRKDRAGALQEYAQKYADRLEHYCRLAPDNWFNLYDYWAPLPKSDEMSEQPRADAA